MESMPSTSESGVRDTSRAVPVSVTQVQSTNPTFDVLSDTELCGFCREPALSKDFDNISKLFQTLKKEFMSTRNQNDCEFVGDIPSFCPPCKKLATQLWECDELIKKTLDKAERIKTKFERRVVDDILLDPEFQSTTQLPLPEKPKGLVQLKNSIFENYRKKLRVEKLQKLGSRSNTIERAASADTLSSTDNDLPDNDTNTQPKTGRDKSAMNRTETSGSYEDASDSYKETPSSRLPLKERIPFTSNKRHQTAATRRGDSNLSCIFCAKSFSSKTAMTYHLQAHIGEKPFNCTICGYASVQKAHLEIHIRSHTGEKPFKCSVCNKSFNQISHLTVHSRTHTGETPFKCAICEKRFGQISGLTRHFRIHTGEKPFKCDVCCKTFTQTSSLNAHKKIHETKP